ncbi:MAG: 5-aminolevulinate synthase [Cyclobacteriaceae bacterium]|nr:5-aminolevulinate synthase [Cyclobacteriaceae bacterium]
MNYNTYFDTHIQALKDSGHYRYFLEVNKSAQHFPKFYFQDSDGVKQSAINWCSNDYLAQSVHEEVISKLSFAANRAGVGSGGTRNISGTTTYHKELEDTLAKLHHKEGALLFSGAYLANVTTLSTLGKLIPNLIFISDERNHASMVEGIKASKNQKIIFRHNDIIHLGEILASLPFDQPKVIVFESVYSINGNIAPVPQVAALAKLYNSLTYIDEVHAVGLYGEDGGGITSLHHVQSEINIINGTLAKGFGVIGGYIAANQNIIDAIRSFGSGFIFTTSLPPAMCAAAIKSIQLVQGNPELRNQYHQRVKLLRQIFSLHEIPFLNNESHITNILIGDPSLCRKIANKLLHESGIYIQPIFYPTVPQGEECLRITLTARHTQDQMEALANSLRTVLDDLMPAKHKATAYG